MSDDRSPAIIEGDSGDTTEWDFSAHRGPPLAQPHAGGEPHTSLIWLPGELRAKGVNVVELDGWERNQPNYFWTDETGKHDTFQGDPVGWVWHHTATSHYDPYVKNAKGQTKANLWMGLLRDDGLLYAERPGTATVVFASGGPANFSAGSGRREVLVDFVARDRRFEGPQREKDTPDYFGNRHYGATETVHPGDRSRVDDEIWEAQLIIAALMCAHYDWSPWRHIGHLDHTVRKPDQRFEQGAPYTIGLMQDSIEIEVGSTAPSPPAAPYPEQTLEASMRNVSFGDGSQESPDPVVRAAQIMLVHHGYNDPHTTDEQFGADGVFREGTKEATQRFQTDIGLPVTGEIDAGTWKALDR